MALSRALRAVVSTGASRLLVGGCAASTSAAASVFETALPASFAASGRSFSSQTPGSGSRSYAPVLPFSFGATPQAEGAKVWVSAPTGTAPTFIPTILVLDAAMYHRLQGPLDLDSIFPRTAEDLQIPGAFGTDVEMPGLDETNGEGMSCHITYNPGNLKRKRRHGFLARMAKKSGRRVINRRKTKGRWKITA